MPLHDPVVKALKRHIAPDPLHPKHRGIKMQAHHLLSQEGIERSRVGHKMVQFGYEIDALDNLSFLPCKLQGACHLGVQPHRGDHAVGSDAPSMRALTGLGGSGGDEENYDDDAHPRSYHHPLRL